MLKETTQASFGTHIYPCAGVMGVSFVSALVGVMDVGEKG
jgi:hypothetical protein